MAKPTLVSGIKPSGQLHIGNYLGALKNFVDLQNSEKYECYFFIADLHAITEPQKPKELSSSILNIAASYLAAGINPKKSVFFLQSQIAAHAELTWILNSITPMGELERMTQFKDKSFKQTEGINVGLFDYPVLMAADVFLYDAHVIPVGDDQLQHLELARTLARKYNNRFGKIFIEPKGLLTKTPRVMSLKDPMKKMSKSTPEGCLFLDDSPKEIAAKIARAVTDSDSEINYDPEKKPGLSNLLEIYSALSHIEIKLVVQEFSGEPYSILKKRLAELVSEHFSDFREKKKAFLTQPEYLADIISAGSKQAETVARAKIDEVKRSIGLTI